MKFSKNNSCLHFLEVKRPEDIDFVMEERAEGVLTPYEEMNTMKNFQQGFFDAKGLFRDRIQFISNTFADAFEKARPKIAPLIDKEPISQTGTMMLRGNKHTTTIFYFVNTEGSIQNWKADLGIIVFLTIKDNQGVQNQLVALRFDRTEENITRNYSAKSFAELGYDSLYWLKFVIHFITFCKYCEIETKIVQPNRKEHHVGQQYKNETPKPIEILDATWFTTIIRSEEFMVGESTGGFFRWQSFGDKNQKRKLIWVMPFKKQGYTRKAKALLQNEQEIKTDSRSIRNR